MKIQDVIDLFRKQVADVSLPRLWDATEALQYLVDAQDVFVRRTGGIADSQTAVIVRVPVTTSVPISPHSPYILRVRSAQLLTARRKITIGREADIGSIGVLSNTALGDYGFTHPPFLDDLDTGDVIAGILGVQENAIRWYKVPTTDDTCILNVFRLPYPRIETEESCLEIDEQHHLHLVKWMKHLAYSKEDGETYDEKLALQNKLLFEEYCETARQEKERQRYRPRTVQYGGIPF